MMLDLQPSFAIPAGTYEMVVENADGQQGSLASALHIVDPPIFTTVSPQMICVDGRSDTITLTGSSFYIQKI